MPSNGSKAAKTQDRVNREQKKIKVYISENAFMGLLLSCAEVFKKESLGYLLGYRLEDRFIIEHAFGFQTAKRKPKGVIFYHRSHKKIQSILSNFEKLQIVGDFHSHTQFGSTKGVPIPSPEDIKGMEADNLYIIVAVNDLEHTRPWRRNRDGSVSGSVGDFFFKITAYFAPRANSLPRKARIYCQFPPGLSVG